MSQQRILGWGKRLLKNRTGRLGVVAVILVVIAGTTWYYQSAHADYINGYRRGDIDGDGRITAGDATLTMNYILGKQTLTPAQKRRADMNKDGKIDLIDSRLILQASQQGDLNGDGKIDAQDVTLALDIATGKVAPTATQLNAGDLNKDGKITVADVILLIKNNFPTGDVNLDGVVNQSDVSALLSVVTGEDSHFSDFQVQLGDINKDGKLTMADVQALQQIVNPVVKTSPTPIPVSTKPHAFSSAKASSVDQLITGDVTNHRMVDIASTINAINSSTTLASLEANLRLFARKYNVNLVFTAQGISLADTTVTDLETYSESDLSQMQWAGRLFVDELAKYPVDWLSINHVDTLVLSKALDLSGFVGLANGLTAAESDGNHYVLFYSTGTFKPEYLSSEWAFRRMIDHEIGHAVSFPDHTGDLINLNPSKAAAYCGSTANCPWVSTHLHPTTGFVTGYAMVNSLEDFADTFAFLFQKDTSLYDPSNVQTVSQWTQADPVLAAKVAAVKNLIKAKVPAMDDSYFAYINGN